MPRAHSATILVLPDRIYHRSYRLVSIVAFEPQQARTITIQVKLGAVKATTSTMFNVAVISLDNHPNPRPSELNNCITKTVQVVVRPCR